MSEKKLNKKEKFAAAARAKENRFSASTSVKMNVPGWWAWLPALIGFLVYANTLNFGFVLDDYAAILENTSTQKGFAAISEIFSTSYRYGYILIADKLYRPIPKAIFAIFWELFPNNAVPGHWLNVLLFSLTCFLIFKSLTKWFPSQPKLALITAMIFAVHPIHTEVVANIKSLDEILALLFALVSLNLFHDYVNTGKGKYIFMSMVLFFLAFLCKESTITFLPVFPLLMYFSGEGSFKQSFKGVAWMLLPTVLFLLIRHRVLHSSGMFSAGATSVADNALMYAKDTLTQITGAVAMLGLYLYKLLVPIQLTFDKSFPEVIPATITDASFIVSALVMIGLLMLAILRFKERNMDSFALFLFFFTIAVTSNIFIRIGTHYGERLLYASSLGIALLLAMVILRFLDKQEGSSKNLSMPVWIVTGILLVFYSGLTIARNPVWKSNATLYESGLISAPNSARVHYYVGLYKVKPDYLETLPEKDRDAAFQNGIGHLKKSVELYPYFTDAWTQLGVASFREKKYVEALKYYDEALKLNRYEPVVLNNSGSVYFEMKNYNEALKRYLEAVKYKPDYADAFMNIGSCYGVGGQYDLAITNLERAIQINPNLSQAYFFLGITWRNKGNEAMAAKYFEMADKTRR